MIKNLFVKFEFPSGTNMLVSLNYSRSWIVLWLCMCNPRIASDSLLVKIFRKQVPFFLFLPVGVVAAVWNWCSIDFLIRFLMINIYLSAIENAHKLFNFFIQSGVKSARGLSLLSVIFASILCKAYANLLSVPHFLLLKNLTIIVQNFIEVNSPNN